MKEHKGNHKSLIPREMNQFFSIGKKGFMTVGIAFVLLLFPIISFSQKTISFSSNNPAVPASNLFVPSTKQPIYRAVFSLSGFNGSGSNMTSVTFTPTGTFVANDISNYEFWWNTTDNLATASSNQPLTTVLAAGNQVTINVNNPWFGDGTTYYCWITADISPFANTDDGHTITVGALTSANFGFTANGVHFSGSISTGGTKTLISSNPNIIVNPSTINGLSYIEGTGPSVAQSYTVRGTMLVGNVTLTAPTHFEISTSSGSGYGSSLTLTQSGGILASTTIYVRLKSGYNIGLYNSENISHTSSGATIKNVVCNGQVTCDLSPPIVTSPVNYCTNTIASPLSAIGQNLMWETSGSSNVGSSTFNKNGQTYSDNTNSNNKITYFTVTSNVSSISLQSLTWAVGKNQSVNGVLIAVQNSDGSAVLNGTQTNGPVTVSAGSNLLELTATFSNLTLTPGNYRVALIGGSGNFGYVNAPTYNQIEPTGSVNITGNSGAQLYTNMQFSYTKQSTTAPTPITSVQGTTYYYVTQTVAGCTSGPSTIEVNVSDAYCNMNTISTGAIVGSPFCPGASVSVPFTISGTFNAGNTFTAQLSDASGGFGSPQNIGSVVQTTAGTISAIIPANTPVGSGYRIRVVGNNPLILGTNNGSNLTVGLIPNATLAVNDATIECGQYGSFVMPVSELGVSYQLYLQDDVTPVAGTVVNGTGNSISFTVTPYVNTTYHVWATSNSGGCRVRLDDFPTMIVSPILVTVTDATLDPNSCPDFLEPFNANTDYYNAGSTLVSFKVARNAAPSSNWGFHFTLPVGAVFAPTGSYQTNIINVNSGPADLLVGVVEATVNVDQSISEVILRFHIVNTPGAAQSIQLQVDDLWDFNCTNPSINVSGTHYISAMPAIGGFN